MNKAVARRQALGMVLAGLVSPPAFAQAPEPWPTRMVRIIVPFAPGGAADSSARTLSELWAPVIGQSVIVENRPGAGSAVGVTAAAQARDGHTLLMGSNSMIINPSLVAAIGYDVARDFDAVGMVSAQPLVLVVPSASPIGTLSDLIAAAKARPGILTAGNSGLGTLAHLTAVLFERQTSTSLTPVPYRGESALIPDMLAGRVDLGFLNLPSVLPHIRAGALRALAVSSPEPIADLPGVATFRALGFGELEVQGWAVLMAPKGTIPPAGLARLAAVLGAALGSDTVAQRFASLGIRPFAAEPAATAALLAREEAQWRRLITERGIKVGE